MTRKLERVFFIDHVRDSDADGLGEIAKGIVKAANWEAGDKLMVKIRLAM